MEWILCVQEEQSGSGSANYDVELIHLAEAHRDILRGGTCIYSLYIYICMYHLVHGWEVRVQGRPLARQAG